MSVCVHGTVHGWEDIFTGADCGTCAQSRPEITEQIAQLANSPFCTHKHTHAQRENKY